MFTLIQLPYLRWIPKILSSHTAPMPRDMDTIQEKEYAHPSIEDICSVTTELLSQCHIPYYRTPYDQDLHDLCIQECRLKNYPIGKAYGKASILKYIPCGVIVASTSYAHLEDRSTQVFIALYTAFLTRVGDTCTGDVGGVYAFTKRFLTGQNQANKGLDGLARLLREIDLHYYGAQAEVILTASLNFIDSTVLDYETQGIPRVSPHSKSCASFLRVMSEICEAYAMFIFPPHVPVKSYVRAVPELCLGINHFNNVLSFYKEDSDLSGEDGNCIFNEAKERGQTRIPVFRELPYDVSLCISQVANILEDSGEAKDAFQGFIGGYVSLHTSYNSRYHLDDLFPPAIGSDYW